MVLQDRAVIIFQFSHQLPPHIPPDVAVQMIIKSSLADRLSFDAHAVSRVGDVVAVWIFLFERTGVVADPSAEF